MAWYDIQDLAREVLSYLKPHNWQTTRLVSKRFREASDWNKLRHRFRLLPEQQAEVQRLLADPSMHKKLTLPVGWGKTWTALGYVLARVESVGESIWPILWITPLGIDIQTKNELDKFLKSAAALAPSATVPRVTHYTLSSPKDRLLGDAQIVIAPGSLRRRTALQRRFSLIVVDEIESIRILSNEYLYLRAQTSLTQKIPEELTSLKIDVYFFVGVPEPIYYQEAKRWIGADERIVHFYTQPRHLDYLQGPVCFYDKKDNITRGVASRIAEFDRDIKYKTLYIPYQMANRGYNIQTANVVFCDPTCNHEQVWGRVRRRGQDRNIKIFCQSHKILSVREAWSCMKKTKQFNNLAFNKDLQSNVSIHYIQIVGGELEETIWRKQNRKLVRKKDEEPIRLSEEREQEIERLEREEREVKRRLREQKAFVAMISKEQNDFAAMINKQQTDFATMISKEQMKPEMIISKAFDGLARWVKDVHIWAMKRYDGFKDIPMLTYAHFKDMPMDKYEDFKVIRLRQYGDFKTDMIIKFNQRILNEREAIRMTMKEPKAVGIKKRRYY